MGSGAYSMQDIWTFVILRLSFQKGINTTRKYQESCLTLHSKLQSPERVGEWKLPWKPRTMEKSSCPQGEPSSQCRLWVCEEREKTCRWPSLVPRISTEKLWLGRNLHQTTAQHLEYRGILKHEWLERKLREVFQCHRSLAVAGEADVLVMMEVNSTVRLGCCVCTLFYINYYLVSLLWPNTLQERI